jgi:predicted nucleotidyltransferase
MANRVSPHCWRPNTILADNLPLVAPGLRCRTLKFNFTAKGVVSLVTARTYNVMPYCHAIEPSGWPETCQNCAMLPSQALASKREQVLALAAARGARSLRVFGSVAKGLDKEGSDLDLLVDLPRGTSLLRIVGLKLDIEDVLGVTVDLCTESELHPDLKAWILAEALPL